MMISNELPKELKDTLENVARTKGCDWDGDIIEYGGKRYYVDISNDVYRIIG